jgi:hypothetical protein
MTTPLTDGTAGAGRAAGTDGTAGTGPEQSTAEISEEIRTVERLRGLRTQVITQMGGPAAVSAIHAAGPPDGPRAHRRVRRSRLVRRNRDLRHVRR